MAIHPSAEERRTEDRLRSLLAADRMIAAELSLPGLLRRIVSVARDVGDARYAAMGVVGPDGLLEQFVHCGMDEATVDAIGELPKGRGLLGAVIEEADPIRLRAAEEDSRSCGVPLNHPTITSFLGVPVRSASSVYGNLYLTNRIHAPDFSGEDEELVAALAATAGIAVENARLYEQAARRQEWLRASAEIGQRLLQSDEAGDILDFIAHSVLKLAPADTVSVVVPALEDPDLMQVAAASGDGAEQLRGLRYRGESSLAWRVMRGEGGLLVESVRQRLDVVVHLSVGVPVSQVMAIALAGDGPALGALIVARAQPLPFTPADLEMAESFAKQATLALEQSEARGDRYRLEVLEDRARIARDLHDHVVQQLFGAGLTIQAALRTVTNSVLRAQLRATIDDLDATIRRIRSFIFELTDVSSRTRSVRMTVMAVVADVAPLLGFSPGVDFQGPLDTLVGDDLTVTAGDVVREWLSELGRSGGATAVQVELEVTSARFSIVIDDDARGADTWSDRSAERQLQAGRVGAEVGVATSPLGGSRLRWSVPIGL